MEEVDHLAHERQTADFDVEAMKIVWAGSRRTFEIADRMSRLVASDPEFRKDNRTMLGRKVLFRNSLRKAAHAWKRINELRLTEEEAAMLRVFVDEASYVDLHWGMFVPAIKGQGTDEQQKKWLSLAYKLHIIGCYAQTELGHGSNVQGLETTATFDPKTDEFIIHSPNLTSSKWWPGGLGKASTHAVVYARLITDGQDYGVHGFIVQLRSLDDHSPLPGITVGDIGMKFGNGAYNTMDNGVLRFDHVRIPRDQMLMRLSQVTREGKYIQSDVPRQLVYGTMVFVRQAIVSDASKALSRAVCIAVRYSAVRRQFGSQDGGPETQVPIPTDQLYAINDSLSAEAAAEDYETRLKHLINKGVVLLSQPKGFPKFDLLLLGMGPDGHIASLFPGHSLLSENERWVAFINDSPKPPPERITFTFPVINSSANVALVVAGSGKADVVHQVFGSTNSSSGLLPVELVKPDDGALTWFTDKAAASKL